jgi:quinoprotein glucose dehydrogenase
MPESGNRGHWFAALSLVALGALAGCGDDKRADTKGGAVDGWPVWGHTQSGQRYSANTQIAPQNVKDLKVAWTYRTGDLSAPGE